MSNPARREVTVHRDRAVAGSPLELVRSKAPGDTPSDSGRGGRRRSRAGLWLAVAALLACGLGIGVGAGLAVQGARTHVAPPAAPCPRTVVARGPVVGVLRIPGRLASKELIRVGTAAPGQVVAVKVQAGDRVERGQILAQLDDVEQQTAVVSAQAQLAAAELDDLSAERRLADIVVAQPVLPLLPEGDDGDEILQGAAGDAQIALLHTGAQLARQQASLALARRQLARRVIRAPIAGEVLSRTVAAGESITASPPGPPLFVIGSDPALLRVTASIDARYVGRVRPEAASFRVAPGGDKQRAATVLGVAPADALEQSPSTYEVTLEAGNLSRELRPGMAVVVALPMSSSAGSLRVPIRALTRLPGSQAPALLLARAGGTTPLPVAVGVTDEGAAEIDGAGLSAGQAIVADAGLCLD